MFMQSFGALELSGLSGGAPARQLEVSGDVK